MSETKMKSEAAKELNNMTWEELNPDWLEDGDLTARFSKSQFDNCPGCGKFEQLKVCNTSHDEQGASVLCLPCGWQVNGETPTEAIANWNTRYEAARTAPADEEVKERVWSKLAERCAKAEREVEALRLIAAVSADEWVSVEERLPDEDGWYLVASDKSGDVDADVFDARFRDGEFMERCVIAWRPLPQPYKRIDSPKSGGAE